MLSNPNLSNNTEYLYKYMTIFSQMNQKKEKFIHTILILNMYARKHFYLFVKLQQQQKKGLFAVCNNFSLNFLENCFQTIITR